MLTLNLTLVQAILIADSLEVCLAQMDQRTARLAEELIARIAMLADAADRGKDTVPF